MPRYNPILDMLTTYPQQALEEQKARVIAAGKQLFDFGVGDPIEPVPEFIVDAVKQAITPQSSYPTVAGSKNFRQSVVGYVQRRFGVSLDVDANILPVSGTKEAVFHLPQLFIDRHAEDNWVVFPDPGYPVCYRGTLFAGGTPVPVPLQDDYIFRPWELDVSILEKCRLLWINSPHNPSGAVMSLDDLHRTAEVCRKYDIVLVSDECYADMYTTDPPHSILECGLDNVLALHSLSKRSGVTGYRTGFVAGDASIIKKMRSYRSNPGLVPQTFINEGATVAWQEDGHAHERREIFARKKSIFVPFFEELGWKVLGVEASLYLWIELPPEWDPDRLASMLLEHGVVVSPGRFFAYTHAGDRHIRMAMVPSMDECQQTLAILRATLGRDRRP